MSAAPAACLEATSPALEFFIFGNPVGMSPSPDMHNAGFAVNGYAHRYSRFDTPDASAVLAKLAEPSCGGGSVTIPHKESVMPGMTSLSAAAKRIGAVNTITKGTDGKLHGDNTDWLGIKAQLEARRRRSGAQALGAGEGVALICGAGGTAKAAAYALQEMGLSLVIIHNRTHERAVALAAEFGAGFVASEVPAVDLEKAGRLDYVVCTLPGSTGFIVGEGVAALLPKYKPMCLEASYIPRRTAFTAQATDAGCEVVEGIEMLFEQGCAQCEIWTGTHAPRAVIAQTLLGALFGASADHPAHTMMEPRIEKPPSLVAEAALGAAAVARKRKRVVD